MGMGWGGGGGEGQDSTSITSNTSLLVHTSYEPLYYYEFANLSVMLSLTSLLCRHQPRYYGVANLFTMMSLPPLQQLLADQPNPGNNGPF